jgi:hypothetical protein
MLTLTTIVVIVFFLGMGIMALASPERITVIFGQPELTPEGRNEVRAVYGGFGVVVAGTLTWAMGAPTYRPGVFLATAAALVGMALGRFVSAAIEPPRRFYPSWFYCGLELGMAAVLGAAAMLQA